MGRPYSARGAEVTLVNDGQQVTLLAYRVTIHTNSDLIDVTNFESGQDPNDPELFYGDWIGGVTSAEVNIEAYESDEENDSLWVLGLKAGKQISTMFICTDVNNAATRTWVFSPATIVDVSTDAESHGAVKHMIRARNRGSWTYPGL